MNVKSWLVKVSLALAVALLFAAKPASATTSLTMDGVWWQTLSRDQKIIAVEGMLAGYHSGYGDGWNGGYRYAIRAYNVPLSKSVPLLTNSLVASATSEPAFSKTFGTYVDEIDVWYEAHPKRTSGFPADLLSRCFADAGPGQFCESYGSAADGN
jgi:hypothetical protein